MEEIVFYGRGGQGAKTAVWMLGQALIIEYPEIVAVQCSNKYGAERSGAPTEAFLRFDLDKKEERIRKRIRIRGPVKKASLAVVLDSTLDVKFDGVERALINTGKSPDEIYLPAAVKEIFTVDAEEIAESRGLGTNVNTAILGALAKVIVVVQLESLCKTVEKMGKKIEANKSAILSGYEKVRLKTSRLNGGVENGV